MNQLILLQRYAVISNFYKTSHQHIFDTIINIYNKHNAVDLVILKDQLKKQSLLEKVGGAEYLMELEESVPIASNVEYYAKIVRKDNKRDLIAATAKIQQEAYNDSLESDELLDMAEKEIFDITQRKFASPTIKLFNILHDTFDHISNLHDREGRLTGYQPVFMTWMI